jgi:hypothetical protein
VLLLTGRQVSDPAEVGSPERPSAESRTLVRSLVQDVGIQVDADPPGHGAGDLVDRSRGEHFVVIDNAEDAWKGAGEVEFTYEPIGKRDAQYTPVEGLDNCDPSERRHGGQAYWRASRDELPTTQIRRGVSVTAGVARQFNARRSQTCRSAALCVVGATRMLVSVTVTINIPADAQARLQAEAARRGITLDQLVSELAAQLPASDKPASNGGLSEFFGSGDSGDPTWATRDIHELRHELAQRSSEVV